MNTPNEFPGGGDPKAEGEKPSRAAEYIAALYVALVLLTPWLLRDATFFAPPSRGVEIQVVNRATADASAAAERASAPAQVSVAPRRP